MTFESFAAASIISIRPPYNLWQISHEVSVKGRRTFDPSHWPAFAERSFGDVDIAMRLLFFSFVT
jgi:hypothetical protein